MKRKRLDRDSWWSFNKVKTPQYQQLRVDTDRFHGLVCLLQLIDGECEYWEFPIAGRVPIIGKGMLWLQLIPDNTSHLMTAMILPTEKTIRGKNYTHSVSVWYVDIIEGIEYDPDGVAAYIDKYLDVVFTPQGDVKIDDRDELDAALKTGDITEKQYQSALAECDRILKQYCTDIEESEVLCLELLKCVLEKIQIDRLVSEILPTYLSYIALL